jgi:PAS domain S-box-containing protein
MPKTKRFLDSLIFKIGVVIAVVEFIILFPMGFYYINRFSNEIDKRIRLRLQTPGVLMGKGLLNYESIEDKKTMEQLVGETLVDALLISINRKVFYSLNRDYVGRKITEIPGINFIDRLNENMTEIEEKISDGQNNYRISITPIRLEDGKTIGFLYIKAGTDQLEHEKKILTGVFIAGSLFCIVLTTCMTVLLLHRIISRRIQHTLAYLKKVEAGHLETRINPIPSQDEIGLLQKDINFMISEIEERTQALQESEDRYKGLVESCPDAIFVQQDGKIVYINPAGLRLFGYESLLELNEYGIQDLLVRQDNHPIEKWMNTLTSGTRSSFIEGKLARRDGELIDVEVIFTPTRYQGKPALQIMARDVTEIKNLRQKAQRMKQLADLGQLSATIAHEIRNPLASIRLGFEKLSDRLTIPEAYKTTLKNIEQGISRIQAIIDGILDFTRQATPDLKKVNLHDLLDSSLSSVHNELEQAGITVIKNYLPIQPYVLVDPLQMIQVFVNLFLNAKQAMVSSGKLTIRTILRTPSTNYKMSFDPSGDRQTRDIANQTPVIEVQIEDTGKGIPPENLEKIFTPFFTTRANGIGLGLAVVSRILEQHQVQISVESQVGVGTRFIIKFPLSGEKYEKSHS